MTKEDILKATEYVYMYRVHLWGSGLKNEYDLLFLDFPTPTDIAEALKAENAPEEIVEEIRNGNKGLWPWNFTKHGQGRWGKEQNYIEIIRYDAIYAAKK